MAYYGYTLLEENEVTILKRANIDSEFNELKQAIVPQLKTQFSGVYFDLGSCNFSSLTNENKTICYTPSFGIYRIDHPSSIDQESYTLLIGYRIGNEEGGDIEPIITNIEPPSYFASQITLHPNPTQNHFVLQLQNPKQQLRNLHLKITDIHGRTLQQLPILQSSIEVDLSEQPNGIYLVQISDGKSWWTEKVVKY